jgi:LacI family transcriptional regulator
VSSEGRPGGERRERAKPRSAAAAGPRRSPVRADGAERSAAEDQTGRPGRANQADRADQAERTPPKRRVTIREVANLAQVSLGTVSNVLNNPSVVAPATRERVLDAIESTGFVRSTAAHQLRVGKSRTVGVLVLDIANPFFTEMVRGAEHVLRERDYVLIVCSSDQSAEREQRYFRVLEEHRVDGLLISPVERDLEGAAELVAHGIPTVLLDRDGSSRGLCSATVDDVRGAELAADHLFEQGHQAIAFVNGPPSIRQCIDRREGARRSTRRARRRGSASLREIVADALTIEQGEAAVKALFAMRPRPSAVMCANDLLALGVLRGLSVAGIVVPDEMAIVGYDDVAFASMLSPSLTSVRQPKYELGVVAAELLLEEMTGLPHDHRDVRFEPELVIRASSTKSPVPALQASPAGPIRTWAGSSGRGAGGSV